MSILDVPLSDLRRRTSMKWRRYPDDVLPLWVAEMDASVPPGVAARLQQALDDGDLGYPAGDTHAEAFAAFARDRWGWEIDPATQITLSPDVMQGMTLTTRLVSEPGDAIVISPPVYPPFYGVLRVTGRTKVEVPLTDDGRLDLPALERAFQGVDGVRPTAYLLCSPHNPNGTVHTADELTELARIARENGVWVISDEIHAPLAPDDFVPYAAVDPRGIVVTSASKSWNLAALKAGLIVAGSEAAEQTRRLTYEETRGASSHWGLLAHTAALTEDRGWLDDLRRELAANRELVAELVADKLPGVGYRPSDGTYLVWLDCSALGLDHPATHFAEKAGVGLNDGRTFGTEFGQWVRMNIATSPAIITEAFERMAVSLR